MIDIFLTEREEDVINHLAKARNAFMDLDGDYHDDEMERFRAKIHDLQNQMMARPTRRYMRVVEAHRAEEQKKSPIVQAMKACASDAVNGSSNMTTLRSAISQNAAKRRKKELRKIIEPYVGVFFSEEHATKHVGARPFK